MEVMVVVVVVIEVEVGVDREAAVDHRPVMSPIDPIIDMSPDQVGDKSRSGQSMFALIDQSPIVGFKNRIWPASHFAGFKKWQLSMVRLNCRLAADWV